MCVSELVAPRMPGVMEVAKILLDVVLAVEGSAALGGFTTEQIQQMVITLGSVKNRLLAAAPERKQLLQKGSDWC